jgi:hypothetical protein
MIDRKGVREGECVGGGVGTKVVIEVESLCDGGSGREGRGNSQCHTNEGIRGKEMRQATHKNDEDDREESSTQAKRGTSMVAVQHKCDPVTRLIVCCLLSAVYCLLSAGCCLISIVSYLLLYVICCPCCYLLSLLSVFCRLWELASGPVLFSIGFAIFSPPICLLGSLL